MLFRSVHLPADRRLPEPLRQSLDTWCQRFPGAWVEDKRYAVALHYRAVAPGRQAAFRAGVRRLVRRHRGVLLEHGKRVFDLKPAIAWSKADALGVWLGTRRPGPAPRGKAPRTLIVFLGDDTNDEPEIGRAHV